MMQHTFNIAAQGFKFPGFGPLIGPLGMVDARVRIAQPVLDLAAWMRVRAARFAVHPRP